MMRILNLCVLGRRCWRLRSFRDHRRSALPAGVPDLSGTCWATTYSPTITVLGGGDPPLNDAGKAAYQKNQSRFA